MTVFVDGFKQVAESDEGNNIGSSTPNRIRVITPVVVPTVETRSATAITTTSATLNARIVAEGGAAITDRRFEWRRAGTAAWTAVTGTAVGADFSATLTGLSPNTTYEFRAFAQNSAGWGHGTILTFTTPPTAVVVPTVETRPATAITTTSATLNARIVADGGAAILGRVFHWRRQGGYWTSRSDVSVSGNYFSLDLTGLSPNTTYEFQAEARNSAGWSRGAILTFTTAAPAPSPAPALISPANHSRQTSSITFQWSSVSGATRYRLYLLLPAGGLWVSDETTSTSYPYSPTVLGAFQWKVRAHVNGTWSNPSEVWVFHFDGLPAPTLISPQNNSETTDLRPMFQWQAVPGSIHYALQVARDNAFTDLVRYHLGGIHGTAWRLDVDLVPGQTYFWRVRSSSPIGQWSSTWQFRVTHPVPAPNLVVSPTAVNATLAQGAGWTNIGTISVANQGGGTLSWGTADNQAWLEVTPVNGTVAAGGTQSVTIQAHATGLTVGTHTGTITFVGASPATGSPDTVMVTLTVTATAVVVPTVETRPATAITATSATLNARIVAEGGAAITDRRFNWRRQGDAAWTGITGTAVGADFSATLTGLSPNTTYEFRAFAQNSAGWGHGTILNFTTLPAAAPPQLHVSPTVITHSLQQGTGWTNIGTVSVTNPGGGTLSWSATDDRVWIEVTPTSNTTTTETDTVTVRATTAGLPVGTHTVTITFTGAGMTRTVSVILTVTAQPLIDLTVPSVTAPSTAERGQTISVAFTVRNQGTAAAGAFTNRVFLATTPHGEHIHLGDFPMPSLAAGTSSLPQTVSVTIHAGTPPGSYYLTVATDGHGVITETNEGNNMGSTEPRRISIDEGEPHIQFIEPSSGVAGDIVRIVGTNFPTDVGVGVRFGNELTDVISRAATEIKVRVPYPGDVYANVEVQIVRGILLRPISNTVAFTYNIPVLHYLYPSRGRAGETVVTLIGENFGHEETPRRRFRVWFGQSIPDVISWTNTRIELKAPSDWGLGIKHQEFLFDLLTIALTAAKEGTERAFELAVKALDFIFDFPEELGVELILREDEPLLTRSAKLLMAFAVPFDVVRVSPAGDVTVDVRVHKWQGELEGISNAKSFTFTDTLLIDIERSLMAHFASPGELRVYDSQGRVTGLVNGEAREEIPYSLFVKENNIVIILSATGTHYFEVAGTEEATYGLTIASVEDGQLEVFAITDVATTETTIDQFEINHEALVQARVVMKTDAGGDGVFEKKRELQLPRPSFTYSPVSPTVGQIITFDASGSSDPDGGIISYHWDFGDGTTGAGKVVEHTFGLAGNYTVTLTVTDNHGVVNSSSVVKALAPPVPPINWALIGGIIAAVVVVGLVALFFLRRRKRAA